MSRWFVDRTSLSRPTEHKNEVGILFRVTKDAAGCSSVLTWLRATATPATFEGFRPLLDQLRDLAKGP